MPFGHFTILCPECGIPGETLPLRRPWWRSSRRLIQCIALLIALIWLGFKYNPAAPTPVGPVQAQRAFINLEFPDQRFTRADLQAIADGTSARRFTPHATAFQEVSLPGDELAAAFIAPSGAFTHTRRYGWPISIVQHRRVGRVSDVYAADTLTQPVSIPGSGWSNFRSRTAWSAHDGFRHSRTIDFLALSGMIVVLIIASTAASLLRRHLPARGSARRTFPALLLLLAVLTITALSLVPRHEYWRTIHFDNPDATPTGISIIQAHDLARASPTGEQSLARIILDAADAAAAAHGLAASETDVLAIGALNRDPYTSDHITRGWPHGAYFLSVYESSPPVPEYAATARWHLEGLTFSTIRPAPARTPLAGIAPSTTRMTYHHIEGRGIAFTLFTLWIIWIAAALPTALARIIDHRRQHKRLQSQRCLSCNYDLSTLRPPVVEATSPPRPEQAHSSY